jgi:hypothetical protein
MLSPRWRRSSVVRFCQRNRLPRGRVARPRYPTTLCHVARASFTWSPRSCRRPRCYRRLHCRISSSSSSSDARGTALSEEAAPSQIHPHGRPSWVLQKKWPTLQHAVLLTMDCEPFAGNVFPKGAHSVRCAFEVPKRLRGLSGAASMLLRPASKKKTKKNRSEAGRPTSLHGQTNTP